MMTRTAIELCQHSVNKKFCVTCKRQAEEIQRANLDVVSMFARCDDLTIECEAPSLHRDQFCERYKAQVGEVAPAEFVRVMENQTKYGVEVRMYFNCSDALASALAAKFPVKSNPGLRNKSCKYRISSVDLFWLLASNGYRLGANAVGFSDKGMVQP